MSITFRTANKNDDAELDFLAETDSKIPLLYDPNFPWDSCAVSSRRDLFANKLDTNDFFEIAISDEKIVGFHIVKKIPYGKLFAGLIITLWVHDDFRNKGIAKTLKDHAEAWAKSLKLDHLETSVHANNKRMLKINENSGFQVAQITLRKKI